MMKFQIHLPPVLPHTDLKVVMDGRDITSHISDIQVHTGRNQATRVVIEFIKVEAEVEVKE